MSGLLFRHQNLPEDPIGISFDLEAENPENMALKEIHSHEEMKGLLVKGKKSYVLLYKKGSEVSDCSYEGLEKASGQHPDVVAMARYQTRNPG